MADSKRRRTPRTSGSSFGNSSYRLDYYGDVAVAPAPSYAPPQRKTRTAPQPVPPSAPTVKPRIHERTRVKARVREQQAVAPFAIVGFLVAAVVAVALLLGYAKLNGVYAQTVQLRNQLTQLQSEAGDLEARYAEVFDMDTLERAVAADGTLSKPTTNQSVYIDLSEPDSVVVYGDDAESTGISGFFRAVGDLLSSAVEFFR
jgi:hypothetical protein